VTQGSSDDGPSRAALNLGTIAGSFTYGFVIGLIASIVFEGFDIASNLLQAAIFGVIFTVVHIGFRLLRSRH
jgi:hypothetical protein